MKEIFRFLACILLFCAATSAQGKPVALKCATDAGGTLTVELDLPAGKMTLGTQATPSFEIPRSTSH